MKQILLFFISFFGLSACAQGNMADKTQIQDTEIKTYIRQMNNIEQCIFPELKNTADPQKVYDSWGNIDGFTMATFQMEVLHDLIGDEKMKKFVEDEEAQRDFHQRLSKLNHNKSNIDKTRCEEFKQNYAQRRAEVKRRFEASQH